MKKAIFKILASLLSFAIALLLSGNIMNRGNVNTTTDMSRATLPIVYMNVDGENINRLYGYTEDMNLGLLRGSITPLDELRGVAFKIQKYGAVIKDITVRVRTVDGDRLIEKIEVTDYIEDDYSIFASVNLKDLYNNGTEYSLQIYLTLSNGEEVFYHTRVISAPSYCAKEKLSFVRNFCEKELYVETNGELAGYMESNYLGDNTTLNKVNIHSSMQQLAFGDLNVVREGEVNLDLKEVASETAVINADYLVSVKEGDAVKRFRVEETFRIKYSPEVTYLLDFERTMEELLYDDSNMVRTDDLMLGITDEDVNLKESDDGNIIAFSVADTLYSYNISDNKLVRLFSFYDNSNFDVRTYHNEYEVKPLNVDEAGNVWFVVNGYMNRGTYEGRVGITLYSFNGITSEVKEAFFIPSDSSSEIVNRDLQELCYLSREGVMYIMLSNTIYAVDTETEQVEVLVSDLEENKYSVSDDSTMMVWQTGETVDSSESLTLMNLNTKQMSEITAPKGQYIKPLAFAGEDFIYGLAYKDDVVTDNTGRTTFPMYCVKIQSKFGETLKQYGSEGQYVTGVSIKDNLLTLTRVRKSESDTLAYAQIENEYITNNQEQATYQNEVGTFVYGGYEKVAHIVLKKEVKSRVIRVVPKQVIYEGTRELSFDRSVSAHDYYYVYYKGRLQNIYTKPSNAVMEADANYGDVVNGNGYYVWYRANRYLRNQIMDLSPDYLPDEYKNELPYCIDRMLEYEGVVRNSEYLLNRGDTVLSILKDGLENMDVLDLTGCSLDSILYYVNRDIPVLALTHSEDAYLIIGFNQLAVVLFDPNAGWYKMGRNEAEALFTENGNQFVTYVYSNS